VVLIRARGCAARSVATRRRRAHPRGWLVRCRVLTGFSADALTELTDRGRLRHALIVRAAGGVVALTAALRTLGRDRDSADESADAGESADFDD
jgi:hypothetical protein